MSVAYLNSKIAERGTLSAAMESVLDECAKKGEEPTAEQRSQMSAWGDKIKTLDAEILELRTTLEANEKFERTIVRVNEIDERHERAALEQREKPAPVVQLSVAQAFVESSAYTEYRGRGFGDRFVVDDIFGLEERAVLGTADIYPVTQRLDFLNGPRVLTPLLAVMNRERVSSGSFDYIKWPIPTGIAVVPEKSAKPEVALVPTLGVGILETYAGWVQITRQALEDAPRVRSQIELRLRQSLARELEEAAATTIAAGAGLPGTATGLEGIRAAAAEIQAAGYQPNAVAMSPADAATLDIDVMNATVAGPTIQNTLWGLNVIPSASIPDGTAYVADWSQAATWFDRGNTEVFITDSHADLFIKNTFVILAEARADFQVTDAAALRAVTVGGLPLAAAAAATTASK